MVRIKSSVTAHKRKKGVLKLAKGQFGFRSRRYKEAIRSVVRGKVFSYRDRKVRKREFRNLWIVRVSAACQMAGLNYSRFMRGLKIAKVEIDRKMLAELAVNSTAAFNQLVETSKQALATLPAAKPAVAKKA